VECLSFGIESMFRIEKAGSASDYRVVDDERGVWIQFLAGRGKSPGGVFKLVVGETVIPFETDRDFIEDAGGDGHRVGPGLSLTGPFTR
jgi:hypothetical protein